MQRTPGMYKVFSCSCYTETIDENGIPYTILQTSLSHPHSIAGYHSAIANDTSNTKVTLPQTKIYHC